MARVLLRVFASIAVLTCALADGDDASCASGTESVQEERGHSMLQTKSERRAPRRFSKVKEHTAKATNGAILEQAPLPNCPLPAGATWCQVRLTNLPPYLMAVYDWNVQKDWVSWNVCNNGFWEDQDMSAFGAPGNMMDIGGNIGYQTFAFAQAGWNVNTFEPMAPNLALMAATLCQNPQLAPKIKIHPFGLGTQAQECKMMAPNDNVGDGFTKCGNLGEIPMPGYKFKEIGTFQVRRLDLVIQQEQIAKVDILKIDVEGYEYQVFAGAPKFLSQFQPRLIKSELWSQMVGTTGTSYLAMFEGEGYKFFSDSRCTIPVDAKFEVLKGGMDVVLCKTAVAPVQPAVAAPPAVAAQPAVAAPPAVAAQPAVAAPPAVAAQPAVAAPPAVAAQPAVAAAPQPASLAVAAAQPAVALTGAQLAVAAAQQHNSQLAVPPAQQPASLAETGPEPPMAAVVVNNELTMNP